MPINHTFLIWVMVIVGGVGNNFGAMFGAVLIYIIWIVSDPMAQLIFLNISHWSGPIGWGAIPDIESRAAQMQVFVLGAIITIALPLLPARLPARDGQARGLARVLRSGRSIRNGLRSANRWGADEPEASTGLSGDEKEQGRRLRAAWRGSVPGAGRPRVGEAESLANAIGSRRDPLTG